MGVVDEGGGQGARGNTTVTHPLIPTENADRSRDTIDAPMTSSEVPRSTKRGPLLALPLRCSLSRSILILDAFERRALDSLRPNYIRAQGPQGRPDVSLTAVL